MQTTEDGEYVPSKELDKSFKIPKKRSLSVEEASNPPIQQPVMETSYYNMTQEPQPCIIAPQQIDAARQLILQSLQKHEYEKPKTYRNHILLETIPDVFDESLPRELTSLFQPLYCKLCSAQLSSNVVAKLHYKSKNHEKKIRKFLIEYSEKTGEPLHKRARLAPKSKETDDETNPLYFYCDICDLPLTGKLHAESHYMGKNHRKATLGMKAPAGKGHYDATGKWVREGSSHNSNQTKIQGDGFGADFHTVPTASFAATSSAGLRCEICNITTTCQEQLESHYNGQKHRKKLKQLNLDAGIVDNASVVEAPKDCSAYRTPSGQFYCHICNSSSNSETQFKQHLQSKNHLKKATQKK